MNSQLDGFEIHKNNTNENTFQLTFKQSSPTLIHSVLKTNLINGYTDETYSTITLTAHSVKTLKEYQEDYKKQHGKHSLLVTDAAKAIRSLVKQLSYLITNEKHTILGYNPEYIVVINDKTFVFLCSELVVPFIENTETVLICNPFSPMDFYFSPEIRRIQKIPVFIHYKTSYFSFACVILYLLLGNNDFYINAMNNAMKDDESILTSVDNHPVKHTKIYWLLSRCLVEPYKNRTILLI